MLENVRQTLTELPPWLLPASGLILLGMVSWLVDLVAKRQLIRLVGRIAELSSITWDDLLVKHGVVRYAAQLLPAIVIYSGAPLIPGLGDTLVVILRNVALAYAVLLMIFAVSAGLSVINDIYVQGVDSHRRPIKGYIQVSKIVLFCIGAILAISALLDKSPLILLSGFGALTAVMLLVFKDTILSLVASIQLSSLDMVRVGDWIEMPQFNADGDVIDVALHTIRIQNWDKTITTIPTHRLISDSFKNWRGMSESGGRRIKRTLLIDMTSVRFLTDDEVRHFKRFALLASYIETKQTELAEFNANLALPTDDDVNLRRLTNLGTLRAYIYDYLKNHAQIHKNMTLLVRQLQPQPEGIPIEIYCFTTTTNWNEYEAIQADIFDHLLALLDQFGLRAYQRPSGADLRACVDQR